MTLLAKVVPSPAYDLQKLLHWGVDSVHVKYRWFSGPFYLDPEVARSRTGAVVVNLTGRAAGTVKVGKR